MEIKEKIKNSIRWVSHLGVKDNMPLYVQKSTILFNQIIRVLFFFMIIGSVGVYFLLKNNELVFVTLGMALMAIIALILNFFSKIQISVIIVSVFLPIYILSAAIYIKVSGQLHSALLYFMPRFLIMVFTIMAVVFNGFRKPARAIFASSTGIICFIFFDFIHEFFGVGFYKMPFIVSHYEVVTMGLTAMFIMILLLIVFLQNVNIQYEKIVLEQKNEIEGQRDEITAQRDEIASQRDLVTDQKKVIEKIHESLTDSIRYAKRIQKVILPGEKGMKEILQKDCFVLYKPKDIVSGDFYFVHVKENLLMIAVADCTGHGVPGAFMSMLGMSFLDEIILQENITEPAEILNQLRYHVVNLLQQKGVSENLNPSEMIVRDGMDISFIVVNSDTLEMQFAGANNPCLIVSNVSSSSSQNENVSRTEQETSRYASLLEGTPELIEIKGDKMPIGIYENMKPFTYQKHQLHQGDTIYMMSDGYEDQFGGPNEKKFLSKNLKKLLMANSQKPMADQKQTLETILNEWIGTGEQIDDITVMGIKI